jgi:hypothetical protein
MIYTSEDLKWDILILQESDSSNDLKCDAPQERHILNLRWYKTTSHYWLLRAQPKRVNTELPFSVK